ncbi:MAG TPA: hypothetical protein VN923_10880, partial [Thermoanaerobaculia bacterium]|nr:hypothetical protein [Thermoanaerobaculia bacterium]
VLCGVAAGGFVWWGAHKVKTIAQEYQDNPAMATVKMLTAVNPDLELVSSDEAAGKVTIKNKKTGEVMTVDLADIKDGKINFENAQGKSSMSFSQEAGKLEVHGANGESATFGSAQLPNWVPAYPGAAPQGVYAAEDATQKSGTFSLTTADAATQVFAFYKGQLESAGFKVSENKYSMGGTDTGMVQGESSDGKRTVTLTVTTDAGKTQVSGVYGEKKG